MTAPDRRLLLHDHPLDAGPRQELVASRIAAGVPHVEEQAAPVPVADVARQIVADPGRDRDEAPPAQEPRDLRRSFPHPCVFPPTPAFQRASSYVSRSARQITATTTRFAPVQTMRSRRPGTSR